MKQVLAALALASLVSSSASAELAPVASRKPAPAFTLKDQNGRPVALSRYKGKVVMLDFWATWCTGCKVEIPWFMEFEKKYRRRGLATIGAAMDDEGWEKINPYVKEHPFNYAIVAGDELLAKTYHVVNMPVTVLIDRKGRIADAHTGVVDKNAWENELRELLNE